MLNHILINADDPLVRLERFKLLAQGCQVLAIGIVAAAIIAPIFNSNLRANFWRSSAGGVVGATFELISLHLIGYIMPKTVEGDRM